MNMFQIFLLFKKKNIYIDKQVAACMQKAHYTTAGMSKCVNNSIEAWEKEINVNLQRFSPVLHRNSHPCC